MNLGNVLSESLKMLRNRPRLFLPKIFSVTLSSLWILGFVNSLGSRSYGAYILSYPLVSLLGVFVSVMVASMVRDSEDENLLSNGFRSAAGEIVPVLAVTVFLIFSGLVLSVPMAAGILLYFSYETFLPAVVGLGISLALIVAASFFIYFLPISILETDSTFQSFRDSAGMSLRNSREVLLLLLVSLVLLGISSLSQGVLRAAGAAGFLAGRLLNSVVTTYLFVVSPEYYLSSRERR